MPLLDESSLMRDCPPTVPVVIIGNGPSGICLSYLLSGYTPYLDPAAVHPNPILYHKLQKAKHLPITEQRHALRDMHSSRQELGKGPPYRHQCDIDTTKFQCHIRSNKRWKSEEQSLEYLSEGLEGRSDNPVAVLFDTLLHPNADLGFEFPSVLQWKLEKQHHIPHLVLGKATPGGAWHAMEGSMLTISLGIWMELPGVNYRDITPGKRRSMTNDRATPEEISSYYKNYVKLMGLQKNFADNTYVTSIEKLHRGLDSDLGEENRIKNGTNNGPRNGKDNGFDYCDQNGTENDHGENGFSYGFKSGTENGSGKDKPGEEEIRRKLSIEDVRENSTPQGLSQGLWEVRGYQQLQGDSHVPFSLFAENVVLATGASDSPARLGVEGEDLPYVFHSVHDLGVAVNRHGKLGPASDPVLVVGAGLSAADAVLCACNHSISVLHVFRKRADDPSLIFKQLPKTLYPEYHRVYHMMCSQTFAASPIACSTSQTVPSASSVLFPDYTSFPEHCVLSFQPDMRCVLRGCSGVLRAFKVSMVLVLIGTYPNLFFLKEQGQYLGLDPSRPISCKQNPVDINPYTFECSAEPSLFAMGPLVGDNFVRFLKGGALGIASCLLKRQNQLKKKGKLIADERECGRVGRGEGRGSGGFV